ncbi:FAD-binding protein, partial [[Ruminococcus] torques]|uniref:FAD-binding protein n=1 Tax=[Ruminococcus] torques TaxID=33039 RepID=UPI001EDDD986
LYQDERIGVVKGVQLRRRGKDYRIAVKNGLVLATGGFENNREMIQNYLQKPALMPMGTLFNRGDGIKMAQ